MESQLSLPLDVRCNPVGSRRGVGTWAFDGTPSVDVVGQMGGGWTSSSNLAEVSFVLAPFFQLITLTYCTLCIRQSLI